MSVDTKNSARSARSARAWAWLLAPALLSGVRAAEPILLLDPGHGGGDLGFKSGGGSEASYVLKTALALEPLLAAAGVPTRLTRRAEEAPPARSRFEPAQDQEIRFVISLHLSQGNQARSGARIYYVPAGSGPPPPAGFEAWGPSPELATRSLRLAEQLARIAGLLGSRVFPLPGGPVEQARTPALILELGCAADTTLAGGDLDPESAAASWAPFLIQLWQEVRM